MKIKFILILTALICFACSSNDDDIPQVSDTLVIDARDGQVYKTVTLGTQTWFAENLNYVTANNTSACYDNNEGNCFTYGKLYEGDAAQTACPDGWHLPTIAEWETLFNYLGGINVAHAFVAPGAMQQGKAIGFDLLAGGRDFAGFEEIAKKGYYWTATDAGLPNAYKVMTLIPDVSVNINASASSGIKMNCRCIKD